jgi:hypothetical protein
MIVSHVLLWTIAILQAAAILALVSQFSTIRGYLESGRYLKLPVGAYAPFAPCIDLRTGKFMGEEGLKSTTGFLLIFLSPECGVCKNLLWDVSNRLGETDSRSVTFYCTGTGRAWETLIIETSKHLQIVGPAEKDIALEFGITSYPTGVEIDLDGRVAGYFYPSTADEVRQRIRSRASRGELVGVA